MAALESGLLLNTEVLLPQDPLLRKDYFQNTNSESKSSRAILDMLKGLEDENAYSSLELAALWKIHLSNNLGTLELAHSEPQPDASTIEIILFDRRSLEELHELRTLSRDLFRDTQLKTLQTLYWLTIARGFLDFGNEFSSHDADTLSRHIASHVQESFLDSRSVELFQSVLEASKN